MFNFRGTYEQHSMARFLQKSPRKCPDILFQACPDPEVSSILSQYWMKLTRYIVNKLDDNVQEEIAYLISSLEILPSMIKDHSEVGSNFFENRNKLSLVFIQDRTLAI